VQRKFFLLGGGDASVAPATELQSRLEAFSASCVPLHIDADARPFREALADEALLGLQLATRHSALCYPLCDVLSPTAQAAGVVDLLVRQPDGRLYGDYLLPGAIRELLRSEGVAQVRTVLIFGAGYVSRAAVLAMKDMGCARFVVAYVSGRRQAEMNQQLRRMRKQISWFPLPEMAQFMAWAEATGAFVSDQVPPTEFSGAERAADKGAKRWELLVNTSGSGRDVLTGDTPLASHNFMFGVNRVLDITSIGQPSGLVSLARHMGITALTGERLAGLHRELILEKVGRVVRGEELQPAVQMPRRRRYVLHRRKV